MAAAWDLAQAGHEVHLYEAEKNVGGLAAGFKDEKWDWTMEKFYHHWFETDKSILKLVADMGKSNKVLFPRPKTSYWIDGKVYRSEMNASALSLPLGLNPIGLALVASTGPDRLAVVGNTTAPGLALVATDGTMDWYCCPRFDSPSVFARLLDHRRGGYFRIAPENEDCVVKQLYFPDTAVRITRFMSEDGVCELVDFMPVADDPKVATDRHRIVRMVRGIRGQMRLSFECAPRFDYALGKHSVDVSDHGTVMSDGQLRLTLHGLEVWNLTAKTCGPGARSTRTRFRSVCDQCRLDWFRADYMQRGV